MEELAWFERQVSVRLVANQHLRRVESPHDAEGDSDLAGLVVHSSPPRMANSSDIMSTDTFGNSGRFKHRNNMLGNPTLPFSLLVARPVPRGEFLGNPLDMEDAIS